MIKISILDKRIKKAYRNASHLFERRSEETAKEMFFRWKETYKCCQVQDSWLETQQYCVFESKEDLDWFIDTFDRPYWIIERDRERGRI